MMMSRWGREKPGEELALPWGCPQPKEIFLLAQTCAWCCNPLRAMSWLGFSPLETIQVPSLCVFNLAGYFLAVTQLAPETRKGREQLPETREKSDPFPKEGKLCLPDPIISPVLAGSLSEKLLLIGTACPGVLLPDDCGGRACWCKSLHVLAFQGRLWGRQSKITGLGRGQDLLGKKPEFLHVCSPQREG